MTRHRMRLVERIVQEGSCDFIVETPTPALAAAILLAAHKQAFKQCSSLVMLPHRQSRYIGGRFVVENSGLCRLLDETGQEIEEVIPEWEGATADERQRNAQDTCGPQQADSVEPSA